MIDAEVSIPADGASLEGTLSIPDGATGLVLFAHGSGSSRKSPRNRLVAGRLREAPLGTLLIDLLTAEEEADDDVSAAHRFDIPMLARRLVGIVDLLASIEPTRALKLGLFGSSTGAAAALLAAAARPSVGAVVSRGGRPDLAGDALGRISTPTLLIVGSRDAEVIQLNRRAFALLGRAGRLEIVAGAGHLFEEPGALDEVARLARGWFETYLTGAELGAPSVEP